MEARDKPVSQLNRVPTTCEHNPLRHYEFFTHEDGKRRGWTFTIRCPNISSRQSAPCINVGAAIESMRREASRCAIS